MIAFNTIMRPRLRHRGEEVKAVREKHQRPKVRDVGNKWKLTYRDYSSGRAQRRSKVWAKSKVRTQREAQRLADKFMDEVNEINNSPIPAARDNNTRPAQSPNCEAVLNGNLTLAELKAKCMELSWPLLKKSTRINYDFFFSTYLVPAFGNQKIDDLTTMELQEFFNSLLEKLSPYTICNMHAALRSALAQAVSWDLIAKNPAIGVRLPKKKPSKQSEMLSFSQIRAVIDRLSDPTKAIVTLIVFGSMRVGEALALRWNDILEDRIVIDERLYEGDLADPKTLHGNREIPFDQQGILRDAVTRIWSKAKFRAADDFVFATRHGTPTERRNVLRHLKAIAGELQLSKNIDFRSFRTMHASLMRRSGARAEIARDNMGHSETTITLEVYSRTWWEERANAVSTVVDMVMNSNPSTDTDQHADSSPRMLFQLETRRQLNGAPTGAPAPEMVQSELVDSVQIIDFNGRGERI